MNLKAFNFSVQGFNHIKKNKECQDSSISDFNENYAIAVVSDGHGGDDYVRSLIGSSAATSVAREQIEYFIKNINKEDLFMNTDKLLGNLKNSIINGWNKLIESHFQFNPFSDEELSMVSEKAKEKYILGNVESAYGTTLIAVVMTQEFWFGLHIGDGKCVVLNCDENFAQPIPTDSRCFLNATTSICDSDASISFRHFFSKEIPVAIFIGSDGVDDSFQNDEQLYNLYKSILFSFGTDDFESAKKELEDLFSKEKGEKVYIDWDLYEGNFSEAMHYSLYERLKKEGFASKYATKKGCKEARKNRKKKQEAHASRAAYSRRRRLLRLAISAV